MSDKSSQYPTDRDDFESLVMKAGNKAIKRLRESGGAFPASDQQKLEAIREDLENRLQEWLGSDVPTEDDEDYEVWIESRAVLDDLSSLDDVRHYVKAYLPDADEYLAKWGL